MVPGAADLFQSRKSLEGGSLTLTLAFHVDTALASRGLLFYAVLSPSSHTLLLAGTTILVPLRKGFLFQDKVLNTQGPKALFQHLC